MRKIELDAMGWRTREDFFDALLSQLGAPRWRGRNLHALWNSLRSDDINQVRPPFEIVLTNVSTCPADLQAYLTTSFAEMVAEARQDGAAITLLLADAR